MKFYANRTDGLGERLNSIFNALILSEIAGVNFGFNWKKSYAFDDKFHSVEPVDQVFSMNFINKYLVDDLELQGAQPFNVPSDFDNFKEYLSASLKNNSVVVPQGIILNRINTLNMSEKTGIYNSVIEKMEFSDEIKKIKSVVNELLTPKNLIVVHIRAGDVIYGMYNIYPAFSSKYIGATTVVALIKKLKEQGKNILVVGQDENFILNLKNRFGIYVTQDFIDVSLYQRLNLAMLEIFLMAKADYVYARTSSGYPRFAIQYGACAYGVPEDIFTINQEEKHLVYELENFNDFYSAQQRSAACFQLFWRKRTINDFENLYELLNLASLQDPYNLMNLFYKAIILYKFNKINAADDTMKKIIDLNLSEANIDIRKSPLARLLSTLTYQKVVSYYDFKEDLLKINNSLYVLLLKFFLLNSNEEKYLILRSLGDSGELSLKRYVVYLSNLLK